LRSRADGSSVEGGASRSRVPGSGTRRNVVNA
jgi:hypothetical protein